MENRKMSAIFDELSIIKKLSHKLMGQYCPDFTQDQAKLLCLLDKGQYTQKQIADIFHITDATLSVRIKRLIELELIEKKQNPSDKREYFIMLSPKGEKSVLELKDSIRKYQDLIDSQISEEDCQNIMKIINKIKKSIKEELDD